MLNKDDCQSYLWCQSRMHKPDCDTCKNYRKVGERVIKPIIPPAMPGDVVWKITKCCGTNDGKVIFYKPTPEFSEPCKHFQEASWWDDPAVCKAVREDGEDGDYPELNIDIWCDECKSRLCTSRERFTWSMMEKVVGTEMYDENTRLEDRYYLTEEAAKEALEKILKENA